MSEVLTPKQQVGFVYGIRDKRLNKYFYIGSTRRKLSLRLTQHLSQAANYTHTNYTFCDYVRRIGRFNVVIDHLETVPLEYLLVREYEYIRKTDGLVNIVSSEAQVGHFSRTRTNKFQQILHGLLQTQYWKYPALWQGLRETALETEAVLDRFKLKIEPDIEERLRLVIGVYKNA